MKSKCLLRIGQADYDLLWSHLFPGDNDEHGAVLLAGLSAIDGKVTLTVREVHLAREGIDYVAGRFGYRALTPTFIHRLITRARDERLVYLAVHNHGTDQDVSFSQIDIASHERGYPALLQIAKGMPVGALVFGRRSIQADVWMPDRSRLSLERAITVGRSITALTPFPYKRKSPADHFYDRQIRMFGSEGQSKLADSKIAVVGLGGIGSIIVEYLARLGVGHFVLIDDDCVETSNLSRIVGASIADAKRMTPKTRVADRLVLQANENAELTLVDQDVAKSSVARQVLDCDYLFLAADSMRARLVVNAIVQQYLIPGVQVGSKISSDRHGNLIDILSVNRPLRPGGGCLWCNQLIDPTQLAKEAKTEEERRTQAYGVEEPNPSVISLNAISAAHSVNDFMLDFLGLRPKTPIFYEEFHLLRGKQHLVLPRQDNDCPECGRDGRYGRADSVELPCLAN